MSTAKVMTMNQSNRHIMVIEQLPRGTALHAARSPLSKEGSKTSSFSKQPSRTVSLSKQLTSTRASALTNCTPETAKLTHATPTATNLNGSSDHAEGLSTPENMDTEATEDHEATRKVSNGADLARRAAHRVNVWKKSEQERRGEEERARQVKQEQEKRKQNHTTLAKQRRRAEIYALNALLRQLQQEKIAQFISAQKHLQDVEQEAASLTATTAALAQVQAIGV